MDWRDLPAAKEAPDAPASRHIFRMVLHTVTLWLFFLVAIPALILRIDQYRFTPPVPPAIPIALAAIAGLVGISCGWNLAVHGKGTPLPLDCTRRLVIQGLYRHVRNPMALLGILQGVLVGIALGSWLTILYALIGAVIWNLTARPWEERDMERRFGPEFIAYRNAVRCWLPHLRPYSPAETSPDSPTQPTI